MLCSGLSNKISGPRIFRPSQQAVLCHEFLAVGDATARFAIVCFELMQSSAPGGRLRHLSSRKSRCHDAMRVEARPGWLATEKDLESTNATRDQQTAGSRDEALMPAIACRLANVSRPNCAWKNAAEFRSRRWTQTPDHACGPIPCILPDRLDADSLSPYSPNSYLAALTRNPRRPTEYPDRLHHPIAGRRLSPAAGAWLRRA